MSNQKQRLIKIYSVLSKEQRAALMEFAEFLFDKSSKKTVVSQQPVFIDPPENESVVAAIKRLTAMYPMLDKGRMLNELSGYMAQHIMQGRDQVEVINEIERSFAEHYQNYKEKLRD